MFQELIKLYNETNSFYYCMTYDLTNSVQRQFQSDYNPGGDIPVWRRCDERFFWNKHMVNELAEMNVSVGLPCWIIALQKQIREKFGNPSKNI